MSTDLLRIGYIGAGGMGRYQAEMFKLAGGNVAVTVADPDPKGRAEFRKIWPDATEVEDYRRLLDDPKIEAVVIATPTGTHRDVGIAAMEAGKPVLLEKPMARTVTQCHELMRASKRTGKLLMVAHCRRYDEHWGAWGKLVRDGVLGSPLLWRSCSAGPGPGRWFMDDALGGGPLIDGAVHNYDFANWLFGDPEQVLASTLKLNQGVTAVDTGSTIVRYAGGNQLLLSWSWYNKGGSLNDILGSKANMFFGNGSVTPPAEDKDQYSYFCVQPVGEPAYLVKATKNFNNMYVNQARHFIACVRGQEVCRTPGEEAIKAVAVAETIFAVGPQGGCAAVRW